MTNHENIVKASAETAVKKKETDIAIRVVSDAVRNMIGGKRKGVPMIGVSEIVTAVTFATTETNLIEMIVTKTIIIGVA